MTARVSPADGAAWVTGASSGIGRGVALELAKRGWRVFATARRRQELEALAREASTLSGTVEAAPGDVTDRAGLAAIVEGIEAKTPIALAFLNAGAHFRDAPGDLGGEAFAKTVALNLLGVVNAYNPAFNAMRRRRKGQIAIMASLAGYGGMPVDSAYSPSKAAAIVFAEGCRFTAARENVMVQVVNPGFIRTPLTEGNLYPMPFLMDCAEASRRIVDGFERGGFEIAFPRRLVWTMKLLRALPYSLYFAIVSRSASAARVTKT